MNRPKTPKSSEDCVSGGPQSALEMRYVEEYLSARGYQLLDLQALPVEDARRLMEEACRYASLKLAEVESRARFREKIRPPS